jgi:hypothetical protein
MPADWPMSAKEESPQAALADGEAEEIVGAGRA